MACVVKASSVARQNCPWSSSSHMFTQDQQLLGARDMGEMLLGERWGKVLRETWREALGGVLRGEALGKVCRKEVLGKTHRRDASGETCRERLLGQTHGGDAPGGTLGERLLGRHTE